MFEQASLGHLMPDWNWEPFSVIGKIHENSISYLDGIWPRCASEMTNGEDFSFLGRLTGVLSRFIQIFFISPTSKFESFQRYS
jgi:hypothetical protein